MVKKTIVTLSIVWLLQVAKINEDIQVIASGTGEAILRVNMLLFECIYLIVL